MPPQPPQVSDFQRLQSMRDQFMEINYFKRHHVDIQIGGQVYEDMPQEMRSRLYYVISDRRDLADALRVSGGGGTDIRGMV